MHTYNIHRKQDPSYFPYIWSITVPIFTVFDRNLPWLCFTRTAFN